MQRQEPSPACVAGLRTQSITQEPGHGAREGPWPRTVTFTCFPWGTAELTDHAAWQRSAASPCPGHLGLGVLLRLGGAVGGAPRAGERSPAFAF